MGPVNGLARDGADAEAIGSAMPIRDLRFDFSDELGCHWCEGQPEFSQIANAFMQALPYLEPYFIYNIREAEAHISEPRLQAEIAAYIGQEARHAQQHKRFNQVLRRHYPGLAAFEADIRVRLERSRRGDSLAYRLAYTAGFETITHRMACFLLEKKDKWLGRADPRVFGMLVWHMVEEVEHKTVAFDVFQALDGRFGLRLRGLQAATRAIVTDIYRMVRHMLEVDGLWQDSESRLRLLRVTCRLIGEFLPGFCDYMQPAHHPRHAADPAIVSEWRARYASGHDLRVLSPSEVG